MHLVVHTAQPADIQLPIWAVRVMVRMHVSLSTADLTRLLLETPCPQGFPHGRMRCGLDLAAACSCTAPHPPRATVEDLELTEAVQQRYATDEPQEAPALAEGADPEDRQNHYGDDEQDRKERAEHNLLPHGAFDYPGLALIATRRVSTRMQMEPPCTSTRCSTASSPVRG